LKTSQAIVLRLASALLVGGAVARVLWFDSLSGIDETFALLVVVGVAVQVVPWESLKSFKAAGVEVVLDRAEVRGALRGLDIPQVDLAVLEEALGRQSEALPALQGSRILWIDDKPHAVMGERRLLRALGCRVVTVVSSEDADRVLAEDADFDLIVSDVQRRGDSHEHNDGVPIHEGVNYLVHLRRQGDSVVRGIPAVFYAAYDAERLESFTAPAMETTPRPSACNDVVTLISSIISLVADARARPIVVPGKKVPTGLR